MQLRPNGTRRAMKTTQATAVHKAAIYLAAHGKTVTSDEYFASLTHAAINDRRAR